MFGQSRRKPPAEISTVMFKILHGALVLFGRLARGERAKVSAFSRLRIQFAGIQPVLPCLQLADHRCLQSGLVCDSLRPSNLMPKPEAAPRASCVRSRAY